MSMKQHPTKSGSRFREWSLANRTYYAVAVFTLTAAITGCGIRNEEPESPNTRLERLRYEDNTVGIERCGVTFPDSEQSNANLYCDKRTPTSSGEFTRRIELGDDSRIGRVARSLVDHAFLAQCIDAHEELRAEVENRSDAGGVPPEVSESWERQGFITYGRHPAFPEPFADRFLVWCYFAMKAAEAPPMHRVRSFLLEVNERVQSGRSLEEPYAVEADGPAR
jgi:hypothetical protein